MGCSMEALWQLSYQVCMAHPGDGLFWQPLEKGAAGVKGGFGFAVLLGNAGAYLAA